ncbi:MAG: enoyl-CoA hydratase-related protein, partial [Pseudomonadota bacterium]|nr:enoyl-CoA hydratase-related protein [Pseudomonadota bacterium]
MLCDTKEPILLRDAKNNVCTLTLNRPKNRNALSSELIGELQQNLDDIAQDKSIRVIILAGNGSIFSSGHDLKEIRNDSSFGS